MVNCSTKDIKSFDSITTSNLGGKWEINCKTDKPTNKCVTTSIVFYIPVQTFVGKEKAYNQEFTLKCVSQDL